MAKDTFRTVSGRVTWAQALKPNNDLQAGLKITELGIEGATIAQQQAVVELVYRVQSAYMALVGSRQWPSLSRGQCGYRPAEG